MINGESPAFMALDPIEIGQGPNGTPEPTCAFAAHNPMTHGSGSAMLVQMQSGPFRISVSGVLWRRRSQAPWPATLAMACNMGINSDVSV